jgi:hypothetical protein
VLLVKSRTRLLGPLATIVRDRAAYAPASPVNSVVAAFHEVDTTLEHLCAAIGLKQAA